MGLTAGTARACITPPLGVHLGGCFTKPLAEFVHDDLWAKCLFLQNGDSRLALVACDLLGLDSDTRSEVLNELGRRLGLRSSELVLICTHNHSGPNSGSGVHPPIDGPYMGELAAKLVGVVMEAEAARQPALAGFAMGHLEGICMNRRIRVKGGRVRMNWEPIPDDEIIDYGPIDPDLGVIRVDSASGQPMAALVRYTCHAAVVSPEPRQISADFPGYACRMIERLWGGGAMAMFANGAFGNINHILKPAAFDAMLAGGASSRPFEEAERVGQRVAAAALELLPGVNVGDVEVGAVESSLTLKTRRPPVATIEEAEAVIREQQERRKAAQVRGDRAEAALAEIDKIYAQHWAGLLRNGREEAEMLLSAFRIGELGVACIPGEPFVEIGQEIKQRSPFGVTWVLGNTNGYTGYLPTRESFEQGGYEVRTCGWSRWAQDADQVVAEKSVELLARLTADG